MKRDKNSRKESSRPDDLTIPTVEAVGRNPACSPNGGRPIVAAAASQGDSPVGVSPRLSGVYKGLLEAEERGVPNATGEEIRRGDQLTARLGARGRGALAPLATEH
jgi:hypothetical protein